MGGAAGTAAAGNGAATRGFTGLGAARGAGALTFGTDATTGAAAGTCWVGIMRFWPGVGRNATVVRMPTASAISRASTALMPTTANPLPISRTGLRPGCSRSGAKSFSMTTVAASASSSGTAL